MLKRPSCCPCCLANRHPLRAHVVWPLHPTRSTSSCSSTYCNTACSRPHWSLLYAAHHDCAHAIPRAWVESPGRQRPWAPHTYSTRAGTSSCPSTNTPCCLPIDTQPPGPFCIGPKQVLFPCWRPPHIHKASHQLLPYLLEHAQQARQAPLTHLPCIATCCCCRPAGCQ